MRITRRIIAGGAAGTVVAGAAIAAAVALSGPVSASTPSATPSPSTSSSTGAASHHPHRGKIRGELGKNFLHTDTVTLDKDGKPQTIEAISGTVTDVSATSITVKASDGVSMTFAVTADTKVGSFDASATPKVAKAAISDVTQNSSVVVGGKVPGTAPTSIDAGRILLKK